MARRAAITAVYDHLVVGLTELKRWLRVPADDTSDDDDIEELFAAAKRAADNECQNSFGFAQYQGSGEDAEDAGIPEDVRNWCKAFMTRNFVRRTNGVASVSVTGSGSTTYSMPDKTMLHPYKRWRGLGGDSTSRRRN